MKHNVTAAMEDYEAKKPLLSEDGRFSLCVPSYFRRIMLIIGLHFRDIALVAGPLVFVVLLYTLDINGGESKSEDMVAVMAWMFIWWVFEAIPLAITALLPLFLLPLLRIQTASAVSKSYTSDSIFLIMGSFILANALQFRNLHKRFALYIISLFGSDPRFLLFGFCIGSGFISMWVDNVAAAAMLMPMAVAVQQKVHAGFDLQRAGLTDGLQAEADDSSVHEQESLGEDAGSKAIQKQSSMYPERHLSNVLVNMDAEDVLKIELDFSRGVAISVALSVTIGGMSTLTGNAANMVLSGIWEAEFPKEKSLSYLQWMLFTVPFAILLILTSWTLLCIFFCPPSAVKPICRSLHSLHFEDELAKLGAVTPDQIAVLVIYLVLIFLWMTKSIGGNIGWAVLFDDYPGNGSVTVLMTIFLFVIPNPLNFKEKLMNWSQCKDIHWNVLLLIGGGFALADGIKASGLSDIMCEKMNFLSSVPYWAIVPAIVTFTSIITEFTSNSATSSIVLPLMAEIAVSMGQHPLYLMVPATLGAQLAYILPIATGPNAVAFTLDILRVRDMARVGCFLKIVGIILLSILMPTLGVLVFSTNSIIQT